MKKSPSKHGVPARKQARNKAKTTLRESEEQFRTMPNAIPQQLKASETNEKESVEGAAEPRKPIENNLVKFRLYVTGDSPNSVAAEFNLRMLCSEYCKDRYEIEIVDVVRYPDRALADGVLLTPLLVRLSPAPILKIAGRLNLFEPIRQALGLSGSESPTPLPSNGTPRVQGRYDIKPADGIE
jgi:circadian clock protein KaiB